MASAELLTFEDFYNQHKSTGKTQLARLLKLSGSIETWSQARASNHAEVVNELSIKDVQSLRRLIESDVSSIGAEDASIVTDQILFLMIGAVKVQAQSQSSTTWPLVNQTIKELIAPKKTFNNSMAYWLAGLALTAGFVFTMTTNHHRAPANTLNPIEVSRGMTINQVGSHTVDNLIDVYQKMQKGECQLPQALVLQPEDREAFIAFVTEGKVTISTADSLKRSLKYADCNYAQKLMSNPLNLSTENG